MKKPVNGERIRQVRELRKITQKELAGLVGIRQPTLAQIEARAYQPNEEVLHKVALHTGFPPDFFRRPTTVDFPLGSLIFRAKASMTASERSQAHRFGEIIYELLESLLSRVEGLEPRLPRLDESAARAAGMTRSFLQHSPTAPIENLTRLLERQGVLVVVAPVNLEHREAFAVWAGARTRRPVIVICRNQPGDRLRWSIAHELGHLVPFPRGSVTDMEQDANEFAAEFLLPEEAMRQELLPPITLANLAKKKQRWGVSIQTLVKRTRDLGITTDRQYRYLSEQIGRRGWRMREPAELDVKIERPKALYQIAQTLYGNPIDYQRLASDATLSVPFIKQIMEANGGEPEPTQTAEPGEMSNLLQFPDPLPFGATSGNQEALDEA